MAGVRLLGQKRGVKGRSPRLEQLEQRQLLAVIPWQTPWEAIEPLASGAFERTLSDTVEAGQPDQFSVSLTAGQLVTFVAQPTGGLRAGLALSGPGGETLATASAPALGRSALIQTVPIAASGLYTVSISGLDQTTGGYDLRLLLNAAVEVESVGGATNNLAAKAQSLDSAFVSLGAGTGSLASVRGSAEVDRADWYRFTLADEQTTTLALNTEGIRIGFTLEVFDEELTLVASGYPGRWYQNSAFVEQSIRNLRDVTADGAPSSYYVRVASTIAVDYALVATQDVDFDSADYAGALAPFNDLDTVTQVTGHLQGSEFADVHLEGVSTLPEGLLNGRGSVSGEWALLGAESDAGGAENTGAAYMYRRTGNTWTLHQKLIAPDGQAGDWFGCVVCVDGNMAAVSARNANNGRGAVYLFRLDGGQWTNFQEIVGPSAAHGDALALRGDQLLVTSPSASPSPSQPSPWQPTRRGAVYSYRYDGTAWVEQQQIVPSVRPDWGYYWSLAMDGNFAVLGASQVNGIDSNDGLAFIYRYDGTHWVEDAVLQAEKPTAFSSFGVNVDISGDRVAIGNRSRTVGHGGEVHIYRRTAGIWQHEGQLILPYPSDPALTTFDLAGDRIVAKATYPQLFCLRNGAWEWMGSLLDASHAESYSWDHDTLTTFGPSANSKNSEIRVYQTDSTQSRRYTVALAAGDSLDVSTSTPGAGYGLAVALRLRAPDGALLALAQANAADGRNAQLTHQVVVPGRYEIEVESLPGTQGRYTLRVNGASGGPVPFSASASHGLHWDVPHPSFAYSPDWLFVDFSEPVMAGSLSGADVLIDGSPSPSFHIENVTQVLWEIPDLADGHHVFEIVGEILSLDGQPLEPVAAVDLTIERFGPKVTVNPLVTSNRTPQITGTVEDPASEVVVVVQELNQFGLAEVHADGTWSIPEGGLGPFGGGTYNLEVRANRIGEYNSFNYDTTFYELTITSYTGVLAGSAWHDANGDGAWFPPELAICGLTLYLDSNGNGRRDAGEPYRQTDAQGDYAFEDLPPGPYDLRAELGEAWAIVPDEAVQGWHFELAPNEKVRHIDWALRLPPAGFSPVTPTGSFIQQRSVTGTIAEPSGIDRLAIGLEQGQTLCAVIHPDPTFQATVSLLRADGRVLTTATAGQPGADVLLPLAAIDVSDAYTLAVTGAGGTTGTYAGTLWLNTLIEGESIGMGSNDSFDAAQQIDASFIGLGLGTAQRGAVTGSLSPESPDWYSFTMAAGQTAGIHLSGAGVALDVFDAAGVPIRSAAEGPGGVVVSELAGPSEGPPVVCFVRITATEATDYGLLVTRDAALPSHLTGDAGPRPLAPSGVAMGYLGDDDPESWTLSLEAGDLVVIATAAHGSQPGAPDTDLDPQVTVYTPDGVVLESDADSRNNCDAKLTFVAPRSGVYRIDVAAEAGQGEYVVEATVERSSAAIGGVVFSDRNGNGVRDEGELPLDGWSVELEPVFRYTGHGPASEYVFGHALAIQNDRAIISQTDYEWARPFVELVNITTGGVLREFSGIQIADHAVFGWAVAFLGDDVLVSAPFDFQHWTGSDAVLLFDGSTGELLRTIYDTSDGEGNRFGTGLASDGKRFLVGARDAHAWLYDGQTGELLRTFDLPGANVGPGTAIALVGDFAYAATRTQVHQFDVETGDLLRSFSWLAGDWSATIEKLQVVGNRLAVTSSTDKVCIFDIESGALLHTLSSPNPSVEEFGAAIAGMGPWMLVGAPSSDGSIPGKVYWYDTDSGRLVRTLEAPEGTPGERSVFGGALAADGYDLLVGSSGDTFDKVYQFRVPRQVDTTVTSGSGGAYAFSNLAPGDYLVRGAGPGARMAGGATVKTVPAATAADGQRELTLAEGQRVLGFDLAVFINEAPVAQADAYACTAGKRIAASAENGVLANDTDPNGQPLTVQRVDGPAHGTLTLQADGSFLYAPADGFVGTDQFTYVASDGELTSAVTTVLLDVTQPAVDPLGVVDFVRLPVDVAQKVYLWQLTAARDGLLTLDLAMPASQGVQLALLTDGGSPLTQATAADGHFRIDWPTAQGAAYQVRLEGIEGAGELRIANLVRLSPTAASVWGTAGDDAFQFDAALRQATINGVAYSLGQVATVTFDGLGGVDSATLAGTAASELATLAPGRATLISAGFSATALHAETIEVIGGGGLDEVDFTDSAGPDQYLGRRSLAAMAGDGFANTARFFPTVRVHATRGSGDSARLDGTSDVETLLASPGVAAWSGKGFAHQLDGVDQVRVFSGGGADQAELADGPGNDVYQFNAISLAAILSDDSVLEGGGTANPLHPPYFVRTDGFGTVAATADPAFADADEAFLFGSRADERFVAHPDRVVMSSDRLDRGGALSLAPYETTVINFDAVRSAGKGGSADEAHFHGSAGIDIYVQERLWGRMAGIGYLNRAFLFDNYFAYGTPNAPAEQADIARLFETELDDHLEAQDNWAELDTPFWDAWVCDFAVVKAECRDAAHGGGGHNISRQRAHDYALLLRNGWETVEDPA